MHWLNQLLLQISDTTSLVTTEIPNWKETATAAPLFTAITAIANLLLAIYVFGYTRKKNTTDIKIKWFLELVYSPNKEAFFGYFKSLNTLKDLIPSNGQWTEQQKIDVMSFIKTEENKFKLEFVDLLAMIAPLVHKSVSIAAENLTDVLVKAVDNDELKLENHKTYTKQIQTPILKAKGEIISAIFEYKG